MKAEKYVCDVYYNMILPFAVFAAPVAQVEVVGFVVAAVLDPWISTFLSIALQRQ